MRLSGGATVTHRQAAAGEGCGHAGEQQIEEALQFGGAVVGGEGGRQRTQLREFGDREPV